uniref:OB-fold nucleic acid binding domain-containing protein n=1 Tax=Helicobacter sp. TaxID=218 RepID=UPI003890DBCE
MFDNLYITQRIQKAQALREQNLNPYSNDLTRTMDNATFLRTYAHLLESRADSGGDFGGASVEAIQDPKVSLESSPVESIVGRVKFIRMMGKACFIKIQDESAILQAYLSKNELSEQEFLVVKKLLEVGDIVNITGYAFVTKTGELSIHASACKILTKSIIPLPEKFH